MGRRAVLTGIGIISPLGIGVHEFHRRLMKGRSAMGPISLFDAGTYPCRIAAEVRNFKAEEFLSRRGREHFSRATQFAAGAAQLALRDAALDLEDARGADILMGSAISSFDVIESQIMRSPSRFEYYEAGLTDPAGMQKAFIFAPAGAIALMLKCEGYVTNMSSSCCSGLNAVGAASQRIESGLSDLVVAGGVDTPITRTILRAFCAGRLVSRENGKPGDAVRPFSRHRAGTALGEGTAVFILEEKERALARGARVYAEFAGFAHGTENTNELFLPQSSGKHWSKIMEEAVRGRKVDHINAHAPGDFRLDKIEAGVLGRVFNREGKPPTVSSIKGAVGSGLAAAGVQQIAAAALTLRTGRIPPTLNHVPDPALSVAVSNKSRKGRPRRVVVSAHAVGGVNAALVMEKGEDT